MAPPTYSTALSFSLAAQLLLLLLLGEVRGDVESPVTSDDIQSRIIPPFSPSLELARSMGSSPETPQRKGNAPIDSPRIIPGRYGINPMDHLLDRPEDLPGNYAAGVAIPDAAYPPDLISPRGPVWPKEDVPPIGDLNLSEEEDDEEECPPALAEGSKIWRRSNRVVRTTLPHMVPSSCTPPTRCSVSATVHRQVFLQDGDTLKIVLEAPPDYTPPTPTFHQQTTTTTTTTATTTPAATSTTMDVATEMSPNMETIDLTITTSESVLAQDGSIDQGTEVPEEDQNEKQAVGNRKDTNSSHNSGPLQPENHDMGKLDLSAKKNEKENQQPKSLKVQKEQKSSKDKKPVKNQDQQQGKQKTKTDKSQPMMSVSLPAPTDLTSFTNRTPGNHENPVSDSQHIASGHPGVHLNNKTHLFSREDHHIPVPEHLDLETSSTRRKRQVVGGSPHFPQLYTSTRKPPAILDGIGAMKNRRKKMNKAEDDTALLAEYKDVEEENQIASSPLTIWKVSLSEWKSCSTREGGQVGETSPDGIVTISPRSLQIGTNYYIGRSSWSSSECFQLKVTVRSAECGEGSLCSGKGACYANTTMKQYSCKCCNGFMGTHCEELNACESNPCRNSGICLDIAEGHDGDTFQCLCPFGFTGRHCETVTNLCDSGPCKNGASCTGNHSTYTCRCPPGWTGKDCSEHGEGGCASQPCNSGICVETPDGFTCFCHPGFGGELCQFQYNECASNPCKNGGTCIDSVGKYQCLCGRGFTGERCENKYDMCSEDPCPENRFCVDKGNSYSCECLNGLSEDNCGPHIEPCTPNPCDNGGTCWVVHDLRNFYCSCRPGFTGTTCQGITLDPHDVAVPETVGAVGTVEPGPLDVHIPIDMPLNHMRNIYVAFATLASALIIFAIVVGACHCRVNRTYRKCFVKIPRPSKVLPSVRRPRPTSLFDKSRWERSSALRLETDPDGAAMPMTSSNSNSDAVYYNMDVCDNQELPLIK